MLLSKNLRDVCIAAELWQEYEKTLSSINIKSFNFKRILENKTNDLEWFKSVPNTPFLENHYINNHFFLKSGELLNNKNKLKDIPISIIQADYDLLCPPINSALFCKGLANIKIIQAFGAGHYISDPGVKELMKKEIDELQHL